ncbi:hypothetical protein GOP47_0009881, partial [Adiantum capillus-veneris]
MGTSPACGSCRKGLAWEVGAARLGREELPFARRRSRLRFLIKSTRTVTPITTKQAPRKVPTMIHTSLVSCLLGGIGAGGTLNRLAGKGLQLGAEKSSRRGRARVGHGKERPQQAISGEKERSNQRQLFCMEVAIAIDAFSL